MSTTGPTFKGVQVVVAPYFENFKDEDGNTVVGFTVHDGDMSRVLKGYLDTNPLSKNKIYVSEAEFKRLERQGVYNER